MGAGILGGWDWGSNIMALIFQTPHNSPSDSPLVPEYPPATQKHQQQQQQRN